MPSELAMIVYAIRISNINKKIKSKLSHHLIQIFVGITRPVDWGRYIMICNLVTITFESGHSSFHGRLKYNFRYFFFNLV